MVALFAQFFVDMYNLRNILAFFSGSIYSLLLGLPATHFKHCFWIFDDSDWTLTKPWGPFSADQLDDISSEVSGLRNWQTGWLYQCVSMSRSSQITVSRVQKYTTVAFWGGRSWSRSTKQQGMDMLIIWTKSRKLRGGREKTKRVSLFWGHMC